MPTSSDRFHEQLNLKMDNEKENKSKEYLKKHQKLTRWFTRLPDTARVLPKETYTQSTVHRV